MTIYVKTYGIQRSGTNLTDIILSNSFRNVKCLKNLFGWKHGPIPNEIDTSGRSWDPDWWSHRYAEKLMRSVTTEMTLAYLSNQIRYVFVAKNPFASCVSFINYQDTLYEKPHAQSFKYSLRDIREQDVYGFALRWNRLYRGWMEWARGRKNSVFIRYEDWLSDYDSQLEKLGFGPVDNRYIVKGIVGTNGIESDEQFDGTEWYIQQQYLSCFDSKTFNLLDSLLDREVVEYLGYQANMPV